MAHNKPAKALTLYMCLSTRKLIFDAQPAMYFDIHDSGMVRKTS